MNKLNKNIVRATVIMLLFALTMAVPGHAHAGILDWVRSVFESESGQATAGPNDIYLDHEIAFAVKKALGKNKYGLDLIQGNSVIQLNNPFGINILQNASAIYATGAENIIQELTMPATAYSSTPDQTDDSPFITARGTYVRDGIVAANFLPFGTKIKIPDLYGNKIFTVEDRMNRRYWHKIDIWFPDRASALEFGLQTVKIQIL